MKGLLWLTAGLLTFAYWAYGQEAKVLRVETHLVELDVIVRHRGKPVADLQKQDFTILDAGQPRQIDIFSVITPETIRQVAEPIPPGMVSNQVATVGGEVPPSLTVILIDRLNSPLLSWPYANKQILEYLRTARPHDRIALYVLSNELRVIQDFTNSPERLLRAAQQVNMATVAGDLRTVEEILGENDEPLQDPMITIMPTRGSEVIARELYMQDAIDRARTTGAALQAIARHMANLPGRKNLIWFSAGFPLNPLVSQTVEAAEKTVRVLNGANVSVYPVDIRGLTPGPPPPALMYMADQTGGLPFVHTNGLKEAIAQAIADSDVTYALGFYVSSQADDSRFHQLKVKVAREGVEVRSREGYFGFASETKGEAARGLDMRQALADPLNATQVRLVGSANASKTRPRSYEIYLRVRVQDLDLEFSKGRWIGELKVAARPDSLTGGTVTVHTVACDYTDAQFKNLLQTGLRLKIDVSAEKQPPRQVQIVVQDVRSGNMGSLWIPVSE